MKSEKCSKVILCFLFQLLSEIHFVMKINDERPRRFDLSEVSKEHKKTAIGNHLKDQQNMSSNDIARNFNILRKCQNKLDCLIFEMLFIKELKTNSAIPSALNYLFRSVLTSLIIFISFQF